MLRIKACNGDGSACTARPGEISVPTGMRIGEMRRKLGTLDAKLLHFDDVLASFGGFDEGREEGRRELVTYHDDLQRILSSWCCTADERFRRLAGVIPYVLPPLEGQREWQSGTKLKWAADALADTFQAAGDRKRMKWIRPSS